MPTSLAEGGWAAHAVEAVRLIMNAKPEVDMLFKRGCLLSVMVIVALAVADLSFGGVAEAPTWEELGRLMIYFFDAGRQPSLQGLSRQWELMDALAFGDSGGGVERADAFLKKALDGYERNTLAMEGRIPLDANPQCILGLYLAEKASGTQLGAWGLQQFEKAVEQAWLVGTGKADSWRNRLQEELLALDQNRKGLFQDAPFSLAELPYFYIYLIRTSPSEAVQQKARECLARCLSVGYGLEPGLRQTVALVDRGVLEDTGAWLEAANHLEQLGHHRKAKDLYWRILRKTDSGEQARETSESLARILLSESRLTEAKTALDLLSQRFPGVECRAEDLRTFLKEFQARREEASRQTISRLTASASDLQTMQLCRLFDALWGPKEAEQQWQRVVDQAEPGNQAQQLGRVYLAMATLQNGKVDAAETMAKDLMASHNPVVQSGGILVSAGIAQAKGDLAESVRLLSRAAQVERPTQLPGWFRNLIPVGLFSEGESVPEVGTQVLFLKAYNALIDGDYDAAVDYLCQTPSVPSLPSDMGRAFAIMMMTACLSVGDFVEAEAQGYQALDVYRSHHPDEAAIKGLFAKIQNVDVSVSQLVVRVRGQSSISPVPSAILRRAINVYEAGAGLDPSLFDAQGPEGGLQRLYLVVKKRQVAQVLTAEYRCARQRLIDAGAADQVLAIEPLMFTAQVIGEESFDRIRSNLSSETANGEEAIARIHRFAQFAFKVNKLELAGNALDAVVSDRVLGVNPDVLEEAAEMYLSAGSHQKALETYERIVTRSEDAGKAQAAKLKIINLCADNLKDYGRAIRECEDFIKRFPDSPQMSQVEFLMGRLAYLNKDYAGAVGQLDAFQRKYPTHPQVGTAMMIAGLSRMSEGNTEDAIGRFKEVIRKYPDGDLAARSKFLIGYAQMSGQQYRAALETFKQLIEQFPESPYATQAKALIDRLAKVAP